MTSPNSESIGRKFLDAVEKQAQSSGMTHIDLLDEAIPEHWEASDPLWPRPEELEITKLGGVMRYHPPWETQLESWIAQGRAQGALAVVVEGVGNGAWRFFPKDEADLQDDCDSIIAVPESDLLGLFYLRPPSRPVRCWMTGVRILGDRTYIDRNH